MLLLFGWGSAHAQAVVTTQDGFVFRGKIISRGADSLTMITEEGKRVSLPYLQVRTVKEEVAHDPYARPPAVKPFILGDRPFFGMSLCSPILGEPWVNLIAGFRMGRFGARLTWMFRDQRGQDQRGHNNRGSGAEFDLLLNLDQYESATADLHVGIGLGPTIDYNGNRVVWSTIRRYTAIGASLYLLGLYLNGTITFGSGEYANPQPLLHVGFVFEPGRMTFFDLL